METLIPWKFLCANDVNEQLSPLPRRKTFAQVLNNACDIPVSQPPTPCIKGDAVSIKIPEDEYQAGLVECRNNLHGHLWFPKGAKPLTFSEIRNCLLKQWSPLSPWNMVSIGKGFLEFSFSSVEDSRKVLAVGAEKIGAGSIRLASWSPDFYPSKVRNTNAQVWIRIYIPREYWRPKILFSVASGIGLPLSLDAASKNKTFGQYARVLVDVDISKPLIDSILVEREGCAFFVDIGYERLPAFCSRCSIIGHETNDCNKNAERKTNHRFRQEYKAKTNMEVANNENENLVHDANEILVENLSDDVAGNAADAEQLQNVAEQNKGHVVNANHAAVTVVNENAVENIQGHVTNAVSTIDTLQMQNTDQDNQIHVIKANSAADAGYSADNGNKDTFERQQANADNRSSDDAANSTRNGADSIDADIGFNSINAEPKLDGADTSLYVENTFENTFEFDADADIGDQENADAVMTRIQEKDVEKSLQNQLCSLHLRTDQNQSHVLPSQQNDQKSGSMENEEVVSESILNSSRLKNDLTILSKFWADDEEVEDEEVQGHNRFQLVVKKSQHKTLRRGTRNRSSRAGPGQHA